MTNDATISGYKILSRIGLNISGGRATYLVEKEEQNFVLKQFQFAKGANWSQFKELEREISILKELQHPQIPRYIDAFESEQGFCLVQEYIPAPSLAEVRSRSLEQIQDIGRQLLEILVYLQSLHPPVLHRDIKPENILFNDQGKVFLVDFGLSRSGSANVSVSSIMVGTTGFIPPELFAGREPSKASDLYSLGATLLGLLTGTPSHNMDRLLGDNFRFSEAAYDEVDRPYAMWLRKMTAVRVRDRFADAATALDALKSQKQLQPELGQFYRESTTSVIDETQEKHQFVSTETMELGRLNHKIAKAKQILDQKPGDLKAMKAYNAAMEAKHNYLIYSGSGEIEAEGSWSFLKSWHLYVASALTVLTVSAGVSLITVDGQINQIDPEEAQKAQVIIPEKELKKPEIELDSDILIHVFKISCIAVVLLLVFNKYRSIYEE